MGKQYQAITGKRVEMVSDSRRLIEIDWILKPKCYCFTFNSVDAFTRLIRDNFQWLKPKTVHKSRPIVASVGKVAREITKKGSNY